MSHVGSPDLVVVWYKCRICRTSCWIDQTCLVNYECNGQPLEIMRPIRGVPTRCSTCVRVYEASHELRDLVVRKPYLLTEGMAGEPETPSWEGEEKQGMKPTLAEESLGDGMDEKGRQSFINKMIQSFVDSAGKGMTEQEVYGNETGLSRHTCHTSTPDEQNCDGRTAAAIEEDHKIAIDERKN